MPKLKTREYIILAVMVLAIIYGAYAIYGTRAEKTAPVNTPQTAADTQKFIGQISQQMNQSAPTPFEAYVIGRAEGAWLHDPFFPRAAYKEWTMAKAPAAEGAAGAAAGAGAKGVLFAYSGYMDSKETRIAIINGIEYKAGDALETEGYVLKSITPNWVIIANKADGTSFRVPIQE